MLHRVCTSIRKIDGRSRRCQSKDPKIKWFVIVLGSVYMLVLLQGDFVYCIAVRSPKLRAKFFVNRAAMCVFDKNLVLKFSCRMHV